MDRILIEKITEMVLSKIQNDTTYLPLSDAELTDWKRLDLNGLSCLPTCETSNEARPLTEEELRDWDTLNAFFQTSPHPHASRPAEKKQIQFHKYV
ncbi:hypothetical protein AC623_07170 [Bacillus sp. FJAT-27231]|uniref:hypothetical protein n=1 Tax=Bacillus sp. FJAT-27231 TaxID=1679168 RepID=UPI000670763A|nr:hypothetical protein [Bacillus sp. FJAT-27231]KMY53780.1 hypothetical protein AC623_07170 [Bacillus sp. FJAT-27231]